MLSHFHTSVPVLHFIAEAPIFTFLWMLEQAPSAATVFTEFDRKKKKKSAFANFKNRSLSSTMITEYHRLLSGEPLATAFILCESLKQTKCTSVFPLG